MMKAIHFLLRSFLCLCLSFQLILPTSLWSQGSQSSSAQSQGLNSEDAAKQKLYESYISSIIKLIQQYKESLGVYQNPFANVFTPEHGNQIYQRLLLRPVNGEMKNSPLAILNFQIRKSIFEKLPFNEKMIKWVIHETSVALEDEDTELEDRQSNLLALENSLQYIGKYTIVTQPSSKDKDDTSKESSKKDKKNKNDKNADDKNNNDKEQEEKKEKQKQKRDDSNLEDEDEDLPEFNDEYKPHTKDTNQGQSDENGKPKKKKIIYEVNFKTKYFGQKLYSDIFRGRDAAFKTANIYPTVQAAEPYRKTPEMMTIYPINKTTMTLYLPSGYIPLSSQDPRVIVERKRNGEYTLKLSEPLKSLTLPLIKNTNEYLNPYALEVITRPTGVNEKEWPEDIRRDLFSKLPKEEGKNNPLLVGKVVEKYIKNEYLYSVDPRDETDVISALKAGKFQCDLAANVMVSILRDFYGIPSRAIGGFNAMRKPDEPEHSVLVSPSTGHAWVEVYFNNEWFVFDPTPIKKDKKEDKKDQNGEAEEFQPQRFDEDDDEQDEQDGQERQNQNSEKTPSQQQQKQPTAKDVKDRIDKNSKSTVEKIIEEAKKRLEEEMKKKENENKKDAEKKDKVIEKKQEKAGNDKSAVDALGEIDKLLEIGSLSLQDKKNTSALIMRAVRLSLKYSLFPLFDSEMILENLNALKTQEDKNHLSQANLMSLYSQAGSLHSKQHPGMVKWLERTLFSIKKNDVNLTFSELLRAQRALLQYYQLLDDSQKTPEFQSLLENIVYLLSSLNTLSASNAADVKLVSEFEKNLPLAARRILKTDYNLVSTGDNTPTTNIAKDLKSEKLSDLKLIADMNPISDFILNATPSPEFKHVKTWQKDATKKTGKDILPLERYSDLARSFVTQPGKSLEDNMRDGTAYTLTKKKGVKIPAGKSMENSERITIILYDNSGSMNGDRLEFQSGLIAAFTAKALSDISPSGRNRHKAVLVPFTETVYEPTPVTTTEQATQLVRKYKTLLSSKSGGTDIQKALVQGFALIADAQKRNGEPLAAANIVLMTDGGSEINLQELQNARKMVDRKTPLQVMFCAIEDTNPQLIEFVTQTREKLGVAQTFYREYKTEDLKFFLEQSKKVPTYDNQSFDSFYTEKDARAISAEDIILMEKIVNLAKIVESQISGHLDIVPVDTIVSQLENLSNSKNFLNTNTQSENTDEIYFRKLRVFLLDSHFYKAQERFQFLMTDLYKNFYFFFKKEINDLKPDEYGQLINLIQRKF